MPLRVLLLLAFAACATGSLPAEEPAAPLKADPAADQFLVAQLAYQEALDTADPKLQQANLDAALVQFSRFLQDHPNHKNALKAWFYSAVCYQKTGKDDAARRCLRAVVEDGRSGPLVGSAAYQLATYHYETKDYKTAEPLFALANTESDNPATRQLALYRLALCLQKLERPAETMKVLEKVLADPKSPFRARAENALAYYYKQNDRSAEALVLFEKMAASADPKIRADGILQSALLARDLKKPDLARSYLEKILDTPGLDEWRGEAQLSLMSEASLTADYARVLTLFNKGRYKLKPDQDLRRLLLAIKACEETGRKDETTALYQELERLSPASKSGFEASYILLSRSYADGTGDFVRSATAFLDRHATEQAADPRTNSVRLMLAETLYKKKDYKQAAATYATIEQGKLDAGNLLGVRYRLANAFLQSGQLEPALRAIDDFLAKHPDDRHAPTLLAKRADAHAAAGNSEAALRDYESLLTKSTNLSLTEYAWTQKAEIHRKADDLEPFLECHRHLLADFPDRSAANRNASEFWTGWALFRLNQFADCIPPLERARQADPAKLGKEATVLLALAHYSLQQLPALEAELLRLLASGDTAKVSANVYGWAGVKIADGELDYSRAWKFLPHAVDLAKPGETKTVVWRSYAKAAVENGDYRNAIPALAILLERDENDYLKAESHYLSARSHFGLNALKEARTAAEDALGLKPQGRLNADIRLLLGDIALGEDNPGEAAKSYVVVAELFASSDRGLQISALRRAAAALEDLGTPEALTDAKRYREQLRSLESTPPAPPGG